MRRLLLALALLLPAAWLVADDYYCDDAGAGTTCSFEAPCPCEYVFDWSNPGFGSVIDKGDTVHMRGGTYVAAEDGIFSSFVLHGGGPTAVVTISGTSVTKTSGTNFCTSGASCQGGTWVGRDIAISGGGKHYQIASVNSTTSITLTTSADPGDSGAGKSVALPGIVGTAAEPITYRRYLDEPVYVDCSGLDGDTPCWGNRGDINLQARKNVHFYGIVQMNSSTQTRFSEHGHVSLTNGSPTITWVDGSQHFEVNPTGNSSVSNLSTRVNWSSGTSYSCGKATSTVSATNGQPTIVRTAGTNFNTATTPPSTAWPGKVLYINDTAYTVLSVQDASNLTLTTNFAEGTGGGKKLTHPGTCSNYDNDDIVLGGVVYVVASVQTTTRLTLTTPYAGSTATVAATYPGEYSSEPFMISPTAEVGGGTPMVVSRCTNNTTCIARTNWGGSSTGPSGLEAHFPPFDDHTPSTFGQDIIANEGSKMINCYIFDTVGGTNMAGSYGPGLELYGNLWQYQGYPGTVRAYGHGGYYEQPSTWPPGCSAQFGAPNCRPTQSVIDSNMMLRSHQLAIQIFGTNTDVTGITFQNNALAAHGHQGYPITTWPAIGTGDLYLGTSGSASTGCPPVAGGTGSTKTMTWGVQHRNSTYFSGGPFILGGAKGTCNNTMTDNYFVSDGDPSIANAVQFGFQIVTGNTFFSAPLTNGTGGPSLPLWNPDTTICANNTCNTSLPTTGADVINYYPNKYDTGKAFIFVHNKDSSATVDVNLFNTAAAGAVPTGGGAIVGQDLKVFNGQCAEPWTCTPLTATNVSGTTITSLPGGGSSISCNTSPCTVRVPSTIAAGEIRQPGFTRGDGVTLYPKPADIGPYVVLLSVERDFDAGEPTPTPTNTNTNTATRTPTRTATFTPSLTPSLTPTNTNTPSRTPTVTPTQTFTSGGPTVTNTFTPSQTFTPSPTQTFTPSQTITQTFTASATPTVTPTPTTLGQAFPISACTLVSPVELVSSPGNYPGSYAATTADHEGTITCPFTVPVEGDYNIWVRTLTPETNADSWYLDLDGDSGGTCMTDNDTTCQSVFDAGEDRDPDQNCVRIVTNGPAHWQRLNRRNQGGQPCSGAGTRFKPHLLPGNHTLKFRGREFASGSTAQMFYIQITSDDGFEPSDPQPTPTPDLSGNGPPHRHPCGFPNGKHWTVYHRHPPTTLERGHTHANCGPPTSR